MSAGLIPFCRYSGETLFLFQKTFSGRKTGYFIDFGGGCNPGESHEQTAAREFIEETETMFLAADIATAKLTEERVRKQSELVLNQLRKTLDRQPTWWSVRRQKQGRPKKDWRTYFVEVSYRPLEPMNLAWQTDTCGRFKKRRELHWIPGQQLLSIYEKEPDRLWKRVRELETGAAIVQQIMEDYCSD